MRHWSLVTGHSSVCGSAAPRRSLNHRTTQPPYIVVESVTPDSPAAKAGVKVGDRLLTYDGKPLPSPAALQAAQQNIFGKKEVALRLQRGSETLTLTVPLGTLGIMVRPDLPPDALKLYEEGSLAPRGRLDEAIAKSTAAAKAAQEAGDKAGAAWLYRRVGEVYEGQRKWQEAREAHVMAWELLKPLTPPASPPSEGGTAGGCRRAVAYAGGIGAVQSEPLPRRTGVV